MAAKPWRGPHHCPSRIDSRFESTNNMRTLGFGHTPSLASEDPASRKACGETDASDVSPQVAAPPRARQRLMEVRQ